MNIICKLGFHSWEGVAAVPVLTVMRNVVSDICWTAAFVSVVNRSSTIGK